MKSYTDLEQSKKLAEILPTESADGYWFKGFPPQPYMVYTKGTPNPGEHIPCWSLAALLDVIPEPVLTYIDKDGWNISTFENNHFKEEVISSNPIDACVEMIIKLNEQKIL